MNLHNRLAKLEAAFARKSSDPTAPSFDLDAMYDQWDQVLNDIERLLGGGPGIDAVLAFFEQELKGIDYILSPYVQSDEKGQRWLAQVRRIPTATLLLFDRLPPDMRSAAATPEVLVKPGDNDWARSWIYEMSWLESRLPPDISPEVVRGLLANRSGRWCTFDNGILCVTCGLRRSSSGTSPPPCPHCGEASWAWARRSDESPAQWRELARQELDPPAS
jgi:hypothetical protein